MKPTPATAVMNADGTIDRVLVGTGHVSLDSTQHIVPVLVVPAGEVRPMVCALDGNDVRDIDDGNAPVEATASYHYALTHPTAKVVHATLVIHRDGADRTEPIYEQSNPTIDVTLTTTVNGEETHYMRVEPDPAIQRLERQVRALKNAVRYLLHWKGGDDVYQLRKEITTAFPEDGR